MTDLNQIALDEILKELSIIDTKLDKLISTCSKSDQHDQKVVQVYESETNEVIASIDEHPDGNIVGIAMDGYEVLVDGEELQKENLLDKPRGDL